MPVQLFLFQIPLAVFFKGTTYIFFVIQVLFPNDEWFIFMID